MNKIAILGRQTDIAYAELSSLYGEDQLKRPLDNIVILDVEDWDFPRLGSTKKAGTLFAETDVNEESINNEISKFIESESRKIHPKRKKINFGASIYKENHQISSSSIEKNIESSLKKKGFKPRRVPSKDAKLSTAQVFHNKLDLAGLELLIVMNKTSAFIGYTTDVQNITSYRKRDQERPARDAKLGMLPPKLAQTMINIAADGLPKSDSISLLDPFCGTGVILQEALLMSFKVHGSDIQKNVIDLCERNMQWLESKFNRVAGKWNLEVGDATKYDWEDQYDLVVSELYLGPPLSVAPTNERLEELMQDSTKLVKETLKNLEKNTKKGTRLCLAVPAWNVNGKTFTLPEVDDLRGLGYNRIRFDRLKNELIYRREDQIVGRHLLVLERI